MAVQHIDLKLAQTSDAATIARMSRDLIENGLPWTWTSARVGRSIKCPNTSVLLARDRGAIVGFAIMYFGNATAHLLLLGVSATHRRTGIARRMVKWLEKSARTAGITAIHVEVRARRLSARAFYRMLGYVDVEVVPFYYSGREPASRMIHNLRRRPAGRIDPILLRGNGNATPLSKRD